MAQIKVSIFCLTYNHKEYIRDTFEGFLSQKVDFLFNVLVFDDASDDGTSDIVREYQQRYPSIFNAYICKSNTYSSPNREELLLDLSEKYLVGKYVAWCEGDDYWIDSRKLQIQVEYMEAHPECFLISHNAICLNCQNNSIHALNPYYGDKKITPGEIILRKNGNLPTASLLYRNIINSDVKNFPKCDVYDWPLQLLLLTRGEVYYIDRIMSVYRFMHDGSWSKETTGNNISFAIHRLGMIKFLSQYDEFTQKRFHNFIVISQNNFFYDNIFGAGTDRIHDYYKQCEIIDKKTNFNYSDYIIQQKRLYRMLFDEKYLDSGIKNYIHMHKKIVIMGVGKFSKMLSCQLENEGIEIEGYVVSDDQLINNNDTEKPVWKLSEYPFSFDDTGIIVAINCGFIIEIMHNLKRVGIYDYYLPYVIGELF